MNVLWLMADQHNPFVAGYAGDPYVQTPNLNALASSGTVFTAAYTPDPICVPARQAFHSGRMASNLDLLNPNYEAMGTFFSRKGFQTAWFGKQHWETMVNAWQETGFDSGKRSKKMLRDAGYPEINDGRRVEQAYVTPYPASFNTDTLTCDQAINFLDDYDGANPFFLGVSLVKPHFPYTIQQEFYAPYANMNIPLPPVNEAMLTDLSVALQADRTKFGIDQLTPQQNQTCRAIYYGMVEYVDQQIGRVLNKLAALGLRDDTIVIYMADHGDLIGQHGMWYKNSFFEGSARVPLIVSLPDVFGPVRLPTIDIPVNTIDLYPTLCSLLSLRAPNSLEGESLADLIFGGDTMPREAFSENKRMGIAARMIRTHEFKYCYYADGLKQLYSMTFDRDTEAVNLASDPAYAAVVADLEARALLNWNPDGLGDDNG